MIGQMSHFYGMHLALCLMRLAFTLEPSLFSRLTPGVSSFQPFFSGFELRRVFTQSKLLYTSDAGALIAFLSLGLCSLAAPA